MVGLVISLSLLAAGWWFGRSRELAHFRELDRRERELTGITLTTCRHAPTSWAISSPELVTASVVISWDYFKAVLSVFHRMMGGRITSLESLVGRARREAVVRLKERTRAAGYDGVIGLRLETARLTNSSGDRGLGGVEVMAYGTAVRRPGSPAPAA